MCCYRFEAGKKPHPSFQVKQVCRAKADRLYLYHQVSNAESSL